MNRYDNLVGQTLNNSSAGMAAGTTSTYSIGVSNACIKGKFIAPTPSVTNAASPTTDAVTGVAFVPLTANQATVLVWGLSTSGGAGLIQLMQGSIVPTETGVTTTAGAFINAPQFPVIPDNIVPLAYCLVRTSPTGSSFTAGTTSWTASGITTSTFQNIGTMPDRPQTS